jgi:hypothetical protein
MLAFARGLKTAPALQLSISSERFSSVTTPVARVSSE